MLILVTLFYITFQLPVVQERITGLVSNYLSKTLQTKVEIKALRFQFFNRLALEGLYVEDQAGHPLFQVGRFEVRLRGIPGWDDSTVIDHIAAKEVKIHIQRNDSVWQHAFLLDLLTPSSAPSKKKTTYKLQLHLKRISLQKITFVKEDNWKGELVKANLDELELTAKPFSLSDETLDVTKIALKSPSIEIRHFLGKDLSTKSTTSTSSWELDGKRLFIHALEIHQGKFSYNNAIDPVKVGFDKNHFSINNIEAALSNSLMTGDTLQSNLKISATEKNGFTLRSLSGKFLLSPRNLSIKQFKLETNQSIIRDQLELSFKKLSDLQAFKSQVFIRANFNKSIIHTEDLAYFIPEFRSKNSYVQASGLLAGTLNDWSIQNLTLQTSSNSYLQGEISVKDLTKRNSFSYVLQIKRSQFLGSEINSWLTAPQKNKLVSVFAALKYIRINGSLLGNNTSTSFKGVASTGLGQIISQLNIINSAKAPSTYSGSLSLDEFALGKLINTPLLGNISGSIDISGKGLGEKNTLIFGKGLIRSLKFKGYNLTDIDLTAQVDNSTLFVKTSIDDAHIKTGDLVARINWENKKLAYEFTGQIEKADLNSLGITSLPLQFKGSIEAAIRGNELVDMEGGVTLRNITLLHDEDLLPIDSLQVMVSNYKDKKRIEINTNEVQGWIDGKFKLADFTTMGQTLLHRYYPTIFKSPAQKTENNQFQFELNTQLVDPFFPLFYPALTGFNNSKIRGEFNDSIQQFSVSVQIPQLRYEKIGADNLSIQLNGVGDSLSMNANARSIQLNESIQLPPVSLIVNGKNDLTRVSILTAADKRGQRVNLNTVVRNYDDGIEVDFTPSDFTINGKSWTLGEGGTLVLRKNRPVSGYLKLAEGEQEIIVKTLEKKSGEKDNLLVSIQNVNLNDFSSFMLPNNRLEGLLSGNFLFKDPLNALAIEADNISTKLLRLDNDSIGELSASLTYDNQLKELKANGKTKNEKEFIGFNLALNFNDSLVSKNKIDLQARSYPITILERFLGDLFTDITGYLTGDVSIIGDLNRPGVIGKGRLSQAGLRVNYTQCYYKIEDRDLELTTSRIDLDGLVLRDTITGNPIYLTGGIDHESFYNLFYDLDISTRKPGSRGPNENKPVQLLRTSASDNSLFYGDIKGTALLQLRGPESDMVMTLNVTASDKDSSHFTLPPGTSRESGIADFLVERKYGVDMQGEKKKANGDNILYDVELTTNPLVEVKVILDELTGDEIKGNGAGTFKIRSGTTEPLTLRGRFDIEEGDYLFTFQSFFKKPFEIRKGGDNYIEWTGDPYDATIRFEAMYKAERVSFGPLASVLNLTSDIGNARSDVYVVARLSDKLFKPTISFYLDFPPNSVANTSPELGLLLKQLQQNSNELNRQVTYLIVFNSFAPNELGGALAGAGVNVNTISGILLSVVSDQINKLFNNLLKSDKYRINLNTSLYNRNLLASTSNTLSLGSNVNFSIGRSFFNNRFTISTGLGMDAPLGQTQASNLQQSILLLPDVTMEWLVNPSGSIRVSFFYRTNADFLTATSNAAAVRSRRAGGSLSYKKDFDRLGELFRRRKNTLK